MATHVNLVQRFVAVLVMVTSPTWVQAQETVAVFQETVNDARPEYPLAEAFGIGPLQQAAIKEAVRLAQEPPASQPKPTESWASRHEWLVRGIVFGALVGIGAWIMYAVSTDS
jgi:hypothetical protein